MNNEEVKLAFRRGTYRWVRDVMPVTSSSTELYSVVFYYDVIERFNNVVEVWQGSKVNLYLISTVSPRVLM